MPDVSELVKGEDRLGNEIWVWPARVGHLGASQVAAVLGLNPFQSEHETQEDILTGRWDPPSHKAGDPAQIGHNHEDAILTDIQDFVRDPDGLGFEDAIVEPWGKANAVHPDFDWWGATPDGRVIIGDQLGTAEAKAPFRGVVGNGVYHWGDPDDVRRPILTPGMSMVERIKEHLSVMPFPLYYASQVQTQLGILSEQGHDVEFGWLGALGLPFRPTSCYTVKRDPILWDMIQEYVVDWYERHIERQEPAPTRSKEEVARMLPKFVPGKPVIFDNPEQIELLEAMQVAKIQMSKLKGTPRKPGIINQLEAQVLSIVGDAQDVLDNEGTKMGAFKKVAQAGGLDQDKLKREYPKAHKACQRPKTTRLQWYANATWKDSVAAHAGLLEE